MRLLPRSLPRSTAWLALVAAFVACASEEATAPGASTRTCTAPAFPAAFRLVDVLPGIALERPVAVAMSGDAYFIAEQGGVVRRVFPADGGWRSETFVDLSSRLAPEGGSEGGLVGFTLSPDFESSGEAFAFYIGVSDRPLFESIIVRLTSRDRRTVTSSEPVFVLHREVPDELGHHYAGHHGGRLRFGPDRQLYVGIGDGAWRDPLARAANPHELFGKVLRIDVLGGKPYRIPDDNPFVRGGGRPEVWALGFRNPWSFWFDPSGRLWLGDVGHDRWEEIDLVVKGGNYGWPYREGRHCFGTTPCDVANVIDPVHEIPRPDGFSVVAGFVYRGDSLPALDGRFLFGDFITGRIWSLDGASDTPGDDRLVLDSGVNLTAIEEGREGEPLVLDYAGRLLRMERGFGGELVSAAEPSSASAPVSLGSLGCLDPSGSGQMDHALVSYEINSELWSDGLDKQRWLGLPRGTRVHVREDGELDFPVGTIFLKEFSSRGRRIETRMLTNDPEIGWRGYTFEWNEAQTDATLIEESKTVDVDGSPWTLPSQAQCFACHRSTARRVLGFEPMQLDDRRAPAYEPNELERLARLGVFDAPVHRPPDAPSLVDPRDDGAPIADRARSWLHANCSACHREVGLGAQMDLRASVPASEMNIVCRDGNDVDFGQQALVRPGEPAQSAILERIRGEEDRRMPPLGTSRIDPTGVEVVSGWVSSLTGCD